LLPFTASRAGKLAACLILGVAALSPSARSQAPNYATTALADNPVAFWQLNEATGATQAKDFSPNGLNGTYGATAVIGSAYAPYTPYLGFALNQTALECTVGDLTSAVKLPALNLNTNAVTIAMWINPGATEVTFTGLLMTRTIGGDAAGFGFGGSTNSAGMAALGYTWNTNNGATYNFNSGLYPVSYLWQFAALVVQSNSATIYLYYVDNLGNTNLQSAVNPIVHDPEAFSSSDAVNGLIMLGSDVNQTTVAAANNVFSGSISDAAVYKSALTSDQILALFAAGVGVNGFGPQITVQPQSQYVLTGSPAHISATGINGTSPISYQWQLNGTNVSALADKANFSGANTNKLTILSATLADAGSYQLILTNLYGTNSSSNAVVVIQAPALVGKWLTNGTLAETSGYSPAGTHDGYDIVGTGNFVFTNDVPLGKLGQSLLLLGGTGIAISNSSSTWDGATYTNTFDNVINNAFTVSLWGKSFPVGWSPFVSKWGEGPPYNTPNGGWQLRAEGSGVNACWTVRDLDAGGLVFGNTGDALDDMATTFPSDDGNWHFYTGTFDTSTGIRNLYVDSVLSAQETNNVAYDLAAFAHLCIGAKDSTPGDTFGQYSTNLGIYDVRIYNYALTASAISTLYGANPAKVNVQPQSVAALFGRSATLNATVAGTPPITFSWTLNGTNISALSDSANFTGQNSNALTIASVGLADAGTYILTVTNLYGTNVSSNAIITIEYPLLVGKWCTNNTLAETSGYQAPGTHDGYDAKGTGGYSFVSDTPPGRAGYSLSLNGTTMIAVSNSSTLDGATYTNTFDGTLSQAMTLAFWAKGFPGAWNYFVAKNGDSGSPNSGWNIRRDGWYSGNNACWTIRSPGGTLVTGAILYGDTDDLGTSTMNINATQWHHYAGTYNVSTGYRNLYVDGALIAQETGNKAYNLPTLEHLTIGGIDDSPGNAFGASFTGEIYDVRVYNYDLTPVAVSNLAALPDPAILGQPQSISVYLAETAVMSIAESGTAPITNQWQFNGANLVDGTYGATVISGSASSKLTIFNVTAAFQGTYNVTISNSKGKQTGIPATLTVIGPTVPPPAANLVGSWLTGAATLADTSGYSPAGTHDGYGVAGTGTPASNYAFTNDVPPGAYGHSLWLEGNTAIAISNSSTVDTAYVNTFDNTINTAMTVMCWAKGVPGGWNPWVSKYGEGPGWQLRINNGADPCWTVRGTSGNDDMASSTATPSDGNWHHYAGTYDSVSGNRILYVDGVVAVSETGNLLYSMAPAEHLTIGGKDQPSGNNFGNYFTGEIYGVYIYDTALTAAQINNSLIWSATSEPSFSGLAGITTGPKGPQFVLTWEGGRLLGATNVTGPWTPTGATSPYTNSMTNSRMFFQLVNP
jgi:hypothetical protein